MTWIASCTATLEGYHCLCRACHNIMTGVIPNGYYRLGEINDDWLKLYNEDEELIDEQVF